MTDDRGRASEGRPPAAPHPAGAPPSDEQRRRLADRITEDALQLLYTSHQDLVEIGQRGPTVDRDLLRSAQECSLAAIAILRVVATTVLDAAWGREPDHVPATPWDAKRPLLFDAMADAWILTCEDTDLLFANAVACELLQCSSDELSRLLRDKSGWPRTIRTVPRSEGVAGETAFDVDVPRRDGSTLRLHVESHALPPVSGLKRSYISLLADRDA